MGVMERERARSLYGNDATECLLARPWGTGSSVAWPTSVTLSMVRHKSTGERPVG